MSALPDNRGERHGNHKLTETAVQALRAAYRPYPGCMKELAAEYKVAPSTARDAIRGHTWKHLGPGV